MSITGSDPILERIRGLRFDDGTAGTGELVRRRWTSWQNPGAMDSKDVFIDGIYQERSYFCAAPSFTTKYYMAFGRIIAARSNSNLLYYLTDHLGSTSGAVDANGAVQPAVRYFPFGAQRTNNWYPDHGYTGQLRDTLSTVGAYYYHARFYSTKFAHFMSADSLAVDGLNRYSYVLNSPTNAIDPSGLYLFAVCGWFQHCNQGDLGEWRNVVLQYWKSTGRFAGANLDDVFNLFAGARATGFSDAELVNIFDVTIRDSSNGGWRLDADNSARELLYTAAAIHNQTGQSITYLAGFSWGGVTVNEYLYGVSSGSPGFSSVGLSLKGVYFVGAPNIHRVNQFANIIATGGDCGIAGTCDVDSVATTLGAPVNFNVAKAFSVQVISRSSPPTKQTGPLTVDTLKSAGEIKGGGDYRPDEGRCNHCVDEQSSWWDAHDLFGLTD